MKQVDLRLARRFDWEALKRKVPSELVIDDSPETLARLFRERAEEIARVPRSAGGSGGEPHLEFGVGEIRFAIGLDQVRSILSPVRMARLPHASDALSHVIHHEGRIVALVDLPALLQLQATQAARAEASNVLLLDTSGSPLGVRVSRLHGVCLIDPAQLAPSSRGSAAGEVLRGITPQMTVVLSVPQLVARLRESVSGASQEEHT